MSKFMLLSCIIALSPLLGDLPASVAESTPPQSELQMLDDLIQITDQNLKNQKELREKVLQYQKQLNIYLKNSSDKDQVLKVARIAHSVLAEIKRLYLIESFQPSFISELTLFSQIAQKRGIPKP